jgi:hypothetical protein
MLKPELLAKLRLPRSRQQQSVLLIALLACSKNNTRNGSKQFILLLTML